MSTSKLGNATGEIGYQAAADYLTRLKGRLDLGWSASFTRYGLGRDLRTEFKNPVAKIPISVRSLREEDSARSFYDAERDPVEKLQVAWRKAFVEKGAHRGICRSRQTE